MRFLKQSLLISALLLPSFAMALSVYQVDAELFFAGQQMTKSSYVILEGDSSRFEERGEGGYQLILSVDENANNTYTIRSQILSDNGKQLILLGTPSIQVQPDSVGQVEFEAESVGVVQLSVNLVRHEQVDESELTECEYRECQ